MDKVYNTFSAVPFVPPVNPGPQPIIPNAATGPQILALTKAFNKNCRIWREYSAPDKALKQQLLSTVQDMYYKTLRHRVTRCANVPTKAIIMHLYSTYGQITPSDLADNDIRLKT